MIAQSAIDRAATPQTLDEEFKRRARKPSSAAASAMLARGRIVAYRDSDTPDGYVIRKHPNGRTETVKVVFEMPETSTTR
jgi:hypothetical protein